MLAIGAANGYAGCHIELVVREGGDAVVQPFVTVLVNVELGTEWAGIVNDDE